MFRERNERPSTAGGLPAEERSGYMQLAAVAGRRRTKRPWMAGLGSNATDIDAADWPLIIRGNGADSHCR